MMHCGLDFGTSNSAIGVATSTGVKLIPVEGEFRTLPSASFYRLAAGGSDGGLEIGRAAISAYIDGDNGRFMRSMKSVLGTSLMDESTQIGARQVRLRSVVAHYVVELKRRAEEACGHELRRVMQGRPVHFVDDDPQADARAQSVLGDILSEAGFDEVAFEFEPVAAATHFESMVERETLALIADIGGGTSDFSLVRVSPGGTQSTDVLANHGIRIGGTDFDRDLSLESVMPLLGYGASLSGSTLEAPSWVYVDLATPSRIAMLHERKSVLNINAMTESSRRDPRFARLRDVVRDRGGHHIAGEVEQAKITLTDVEHAVINLDFVEAGLTAEADREMLRRSIHRPLGRLAEAVDECLRRAGVTADEVPLAVMTGGSTEMPMVRTAIAAQVPSARIENCDRFGAVAAGLARRAANTFCE